jgi:hypothetical protein
MAYGGGSTGESGLSGMIMSLPAHDESLVSVVREKVNRRHRDVNVIAPLAGKSYCHSKWKQSLGQLPLDRCHVLIYDNSNSQRFGKKIEDFCVNQLDSFTLVRDQNNRCGLEKSRDWVKVGNRCRSIYGTIYNKLVDQKRPLCLNLEDDIGVPDMAWDRLYSQIQNDGVGTVIGQCNDRRAFVDYGVKRTIAVNFKVTETLGQTESIEVATTPVTVREFGVETIGSGHMGLWLTQTEAISQLGDGTSVR